MENTGQPKPLSEELHLNVRDPKSPDNKSPDAPTNPIQDYDKLTKPENTLTED